MNSVLKLLLEGEPLDTAQIGKILNMGQAAVESQLAELRQQGILLGWRAVLNPSFEAERRVRAVIEIKIRTEGTGGFDVIAERISQFEQVESCYLMSGGYDLLVVVTADNLYKVAGFVHERLARLEGVQGTSTHFFLRAYKKDGFVITDEASRRDRPSVSP
ncbi:MAG: Lrp/AsnC family transcriptional regulator [Verrucomicrobia bacterium]|jgi:DNA-binding Lrp family transcriptional regulator|nr:Lrp/AsnC family transcriptional regulator [Verrucomicrobiota bacterium]